MPRHYTMPAVCNAKILSSYVLIIFPTHLKFKIQHSKFLSVLSFSVSKDGGWGIGLAFVAIVHRYKV